MTTVDVNVHHVTRVEGHGDIVVDVKNGEIKECRFEVVEAPRFFEAFVRGRPYYELSHITSRICGICAVGHATASLRATEKALGVEPSEQTVLLRKLNFHGEIIDSHVLHTYMLVVPDFLGVGSVIPLAKTHREVVGRALRNEDITVYNDGTQIRAWCYVSDFIDALCKLLAAGPSGRHVLNIGNPQATVTVLGLAACIWLPALAERQHTGVDRLLEGYLDYTNHFVYPQQLLYSGWGHGLSVPGYGDGMCLSLGWSHLLLALAAWVWLKLRSQAEELHVWRFFAAATAVLCAFMLPGSMWAWVTRLNQKSPSGVFGCSQLLRMSHPGDRRLFWEQVACKLEEVINLYSSN